MPPISLKPDEQLPSDIKEELSKANKAYTNNKSFPSYKEQIRTIFGLDEPKITDNAKLYLAGFIEGEGSLNVSIKKLDTASFGVLLDPEFSITQHANGIANLYLAMCVFQTGRLSLKSGSKATLVYKIDNRDSLKEKVIPFFDSFVIPYGSDAKKQRKALFSYLLDCFEKKKHKNIDSFINEMFPIWDSLRMQKGQSNETFKDLDDAISYVINFHNNKNE
jgi:hypothetical protein